MKTYKLHSLYYFISSWLLLASVASCQCKPSASTSPIQEVTPVEKATQKGIWHTGKFDKKITPTIPEGIIIPHLYKNYTFHLYRVTHNGSCGYRSFIPILLAEILVHDKWKDWLESMRTTFYEPAKAILQPLDLTGTKYIQFRPTDNPDKLLADIKDLLQKLSQEPGARPLQEPEIELLVDFLRQTILMNWILAANKKLENIKKRNPATTYTITQKIDEFFDRPKFNKKSFWAQDSDFLIFYLPFYIDLVDSYPRHIGYYPYPESEKGNPHLVTDTRSLKATIRYFPGCSPDPDKFPKELPPIWLYHHDEEYFEYLVYEEVN